MTRLLTLIELAKRKESKRQLCMLDYERVAVEFEISTRTLLRWKKGYEQQGVKGLVPKVSTGRPACPINGYTAKKITDYRSRYNWGAEVICIHLLMDHGVDVSQKRVHRFLKRKKLVVKKGKRTKPPKHTQVVKVAEPGAHTQNDVKHLPDILLSGQKSYVYNFVDHASKFEVKRAYDSYGPSETRDFFERVLEALPFTVTRWQTDNGIEFTNKYVSIVDTPKVHVLDKLCKKHGIRHVLIPPGEKELQGLVERNHRMDDDELYHRIRPKDLKELNRFLTEHYQWKNSRRRRKALGWKTPNEWLQEYAKRVSEGENPGLVRPAAPLEIPARKPNDALEPQQGTRHHRLESWRQAGQAATHEITGGHAPDPTRIFSRADTENGSHDERQKNERQDANETQETINRRAA